MTVLWGHPRKQGLGVAERQLAQGKHGGRGWDFRGEGERAMMEQHPPLGKGDQQVETPWVRRNSEAFGTVSCFRGVCPDRALLVLWGSSATVCVTSSQSKNVVCSLVPTLTLLRAACQGQRALRVPSPPWSSDVAWSEPELFS